MRIVQEARLSALLVALVFALFVAPLLGRAESGEFWFQTSVVLAIGAGLYATSNRRGALFVAVALLVPVTYAWFGPDILPHKSDDVLRLLTTAACFIYTAGVVGASLAKHEHVTRETLMGGVNVYLLLIFAFSLGHASIEVVTSGSYTIAGQPLFERTTQDYDGRGFATVVYFSTTTLTTLGFGDIVPARAPARMLTSAQAVIGQLYLAIFIGRLVGLEVGERAAARRIAADDIEAARERNAT